MELASRNDALKREAEAQAFRASQLANCFIKLNDVITETLQHISKGLLS